jgi:hypothetical protein
MKEEKKNKKSIVLILLLLLVAISGGIAFGTYAKYVEEITGNNGTATIASWAFATDNQTQNITVALNPTVDATTLTNGTIAPGASGSFNIALKNTNTDVAVEFVVKLSSVTGAPTNLKFYKDSSYTTEITPGDTEVKGKLAAKDSTGVTVPVYWKWDYETTGGDTVDTNEGKTGGDMTVNVSIKGTQLPPSNTAVTSGLDA